MRLLATVFAMLAATSLAGAATAQETSQVEALFKAWDKDGDGALSKAEWLDAGRRAEGYAQVDGDGDDKITLEELKSAMARLQRGG